MKRHGIILSGALLLSLSLGGCTPIITSGYSAPAEPTQTAAAEEVPTPTAEAPETPVEAAPVVSDCTAPATATETLNCLTIQPEVDDSSYDRDFFGSGWVDADDNGCDTRNDILTRDLVDTTIAADCKVMAGVLNDTYTGKTIQFTRGQKSSMDVQIDHIFSLRNAWYAGARNWTEEQRVEFANDPLNLKAADGPANNSKGADGPDLWLPQGDTCGYVTSYVNVSFTYQLSITPAVQSAIADVLAGC